MKYWMQFLLFVFVWNLTSACGVKGNPLAPLEPEVLGIGQPDYRGAEEAIKNSEEDEKKQKVDPSPGTNP